MRRYGPSLPLQRTPRRQTAPRPRRQQSPVQPGRALRVLHDHDQSRATLASQTGGSLTWRRPAFPCPASSDSSSSRSTTGSSRRSSAASATTTAQPFATTWSLFSATERRNACSSAGPCSGRKARRPLQRLEVVHGHEVVDEGEAPPEGGPLEARAYACSDRRPAVGKALSIPFRVSVSAQQES